jgi:Tol biopolymer transport system component
MLTHIRRRRILIAALAGAAFAALGVTITSSHAAASAHRNGLIAVTHRSFSVTCCVITTDVLTMKADGSDPRQLTTTAPGGESADPAWAREGNRIYFESDRAGNPHLFSINSNGHDVKQLTSGNGLEFTPSPSPDGKLIAFDGTTPDGTVQGIFLTDKHGGSSYSGFRQLTLSPAIATGGFDTSPNFSPDGTKVAFQRLLSDSMAAVFVVGVDGSGLKQLTPYSMNAEYPRWSPDGTRLVFSSNPDNNFDQQDIWFVGADGNGLTQLTHGAPGNPSFEPDWSPDGRKIVFAHFLPTGFFTQVEVMDADGNNIHVIWQGADHSYDLRPDWGTRP